MTTTTILERVPVDRITEQAAQVKFSRTVLAAVAWLLFGAGWVTAKGFGVAWLGVVWCAVAVRVGWRDARGNQPTRATLREENTRLRQQLARMGVGADE